ncbi:ROK family protein [Sphingomonas sp. ID0503]|uniref:ROK family protein n=1 Tax=Sphingomonas sp. ID0503 TaxID=3399691 RepID=UPI003AFAFFE7
MTRPRIGIDFGGTKIETAAIGADGEWLHRVRTPTPRNYEAAVAETVRLIRETGAAIGGEASVGIGIAGSPSPRTGLMRNANATFLNGRPFGADVEVALGRPVRIENDANCLALSEAHDGAAAGARTAFAIIIGTGCGGGVVVDGRTVTGANGIAGEWGHVPLPWPGFAEVPGPSCWCGQHGCLEMWVSGTGIRRDHLERTGAVTDAAEIVTAARAGEPGAVETLDLYVDRLGRAMAMAANLIDPDVFVLGGGMSNVPELYDRLPAVIERYVFADEWRAVIAPAKWGDSSGVRGAARLWPEDGRGG